MLRGLLVEKWEEVDNDIPVVVTWEEVDSDVPLNVPWEVVDDDVPGEEPLDVLEVAVLSVTLATSIVPKPTERVKLFKQFGQAKRPC